MRSLSILFLLVLCLVMVKIVWSGANLTFDDANYLFYAHQILNGTFNYAESPFAYGYLLPYTVAISIHFLGGITSLASSIPAILEYIILILIIYFTSFKMSNEKVALSVAVIAATSAFIVAYSSRVLPDLLAGDMVGLAVYLLIYEDELHATRNMFAGFLTGLLVFVKFSTLLIGIPIALVLFLQRKLYAWIYLVCALVIILFYLITINGNFSEFVSNDAYQIHLNTTNFYTNIETFLLFVIPFLIVTPNVVYWQIFPLGLLFDFAFIGGYIALLKKEWKFSKWFLVLIFSFLFMLFGSESLIRYVPITVVSRYFILLAVPMAILTTRFLLGVHDYLRFKYKPLTADVVLICLVIIAVIVQLPVLYFFHTFVPSYVGAPIQHNLTIIGRPNMS